MKRYENFWDRIAKRYARSPVADEDAYRAKLERTRAYLTPETKAFEFGCGTGSTAVHHAPHLKNILAIDVSRNMIEIARAKAEAKHLDNVRFEIGSIEEFQVTDESFDIVMAHSILHLLEDKRAALSKAYAMLKPGGVFVSSTACMGDTFATNVIGFGVAAVSFTGLLPYINVFSSRQLMQSITDTGFAIEQEWRPRKGAALFLIARKT